MKNLSIFSFLLCLMLCFAACEGPMGDPGLDGKDGIDGVDGKDGEDGGDGRDGKDGNANVKTFNFNVSIGSFTKDYNINTYKYNKTISGMDIDLNDAVLVYVYKGNNLWTALPFTWYWNDDDYGNHYSYLRESKNNSDKIYLEIRSTTGEWLVSSTASFSYKVVVIKGTSGGKRALDTNRDLSSLKCHELNQVLGVPEHIDLCDYEQAKGYFGLED